MATLGSIQLKFFQFAEPDYEERNLGYIYKWSKDDYDGIELKLFVRNHLVNTASGGVKITHKYFVEIFDKKANPIRTLPYSEVEGNDVADLIEGALAEPTCPICKLLDSNEQFRDDVDLQVPRVAAVAQQVALAKSLSMQPARVAPSPIVRL